MKTIVLVLMTFTNSIQAQYYIAEKEMIPPSIILIDQYQPLGAGSFGHWQNNWDVKNIYTRVVAIRDEQGRLFHILYQEDFSGNLSFFSYSKNLVPIFERADKPMQQFDQCIKQQMGVLKMLREAETVIECFMQRLAYCSD